MSKTPESLEIYLAQIARELRDLPSQARADELREIEAHLRAMVLASQQLEDLSDAEATEAALRQFGKPRVVGKNLRCAWKRQQPESWWRALLAPIAGLLFFSLDVLIYNRLYDAINARFNDVLSYDWSASIYCCFGLWMLATFFFTGFIVGVASPKRGFWLTLAFLLYCAYELVANPLTSGDATNVYLSIFICIVCPLIALAGTYFGARRSGKMSTRIESGGNKVFARIAQSRKVLANVAGDKLNVQL